MDDQARIKAIKTIAISGLLISSSLYLYTINALNKEVKALNRRLDHKNDRLRDANRYINKITEVLDPTEGQIARINETFDLEKWDESLDSPEVKHL